MLTKERYLSSDILKIKLIKYTIQHYVIKFVSDLRQVGGHLQYSGILHQ
jgi:hypothetical protein